MGAQSSKSKRKKLKQEIGILDQIFHEMAVRSPDDTIAKDTFLKFFDLPGVLGDRLFEVFDTKKTGVIDFEEFIDGFQIFSRGDPSKKMDMLFQLFDLDGKGGITKQELSTVLMSIVTPPNQVVNGPNNKYKSRRSSAIGVVSQTPTPQLLPQQNSSPNSPQSPISPKLINSNNTTLQPLGGGGGGGGDTPALGNNDSSFILDKLQSSFISETETRPLNIEMVQQKVDQIVKQAFAECDVDKSSRLDAQEFRNWIKNKPEIIDACEELFVQLAWNGPQITLRHNFNMENAENMSMYDTIEFESNVHSECSGDCKLRFVCSRDQIPPPPENKEEKERELQYDYIILTHSTDTQQIFNFCPKCGQSLIHPSNPPKSNIALQALSSATPILSVNNSSAMPVTAMSLSQSMRGLGGVDQNNYEGNLKMDVGKFRQLKTRYVVLHGKFLYIYKNKNKPFPDTVVFTQGYYCNLSVNQKFPHYQYIRLNPPGGSTGKTVHLYADTGKEAHKWLEILEISAQTVSISRYYELGPILGKGSFAHVCHATEKSCGRKVAVKIIEKKVIDGKQKEYIRIEMSVMKLVRHPNVMRLEQVFETKTKIYLVMPLYVGGDLYEYMKHYARHGLKEDEAKQVIFKVLSALFYLHSVGIVHRDLKPENLLLVRDKEPTDIVITDFGLSKFAAPHEAMKAACGTLSYVAPEVLRMEGYGKEVDLWSTGVIMFLTLRAKLPFHDTTKNRIIARILRQNVQMVDPHWQKISKQAKDLISKLLIKNPAQRITCENAMKHPWFEIIREEKRKKQQQLLKAQQLQQLQQVQVRAKQGKKEKDLLPDKTGMESVRDIKVYGYMDNNNDDDEDEGDDDDDDENEQKSDDDDDDDDSAPITVIRQHSINRRGW